MNWQFILANALLVLGFGFVIFWHELGHFLAAKYVGIRVEQFAVGFGHALISWRKGMGFQAGTSGRRYEKLQKAAAEGDTSVDLSKYGETEYRLNWIPLGGYVKMLGQDDLNPNSRSDDPRSYNSKSVPARMLVVSAGVIMNIILAAILFMVLFRTGFTAPAPIVGGVVPMSPAQRGGVLTGDRLITFNGNRTHDFTKLMLNVALAEGGTAVPLEVERLEDGKLTKKKLEVVPRRADATATKQFVQVGMAQPFAMEGLKLAKDGPTLDEILKEQGAMLPDLLAIRPGDVITKINGKPVERDDPKQVYKTGRNLVLLDRELQASRGAPLVLTVKGAGNGPEREERVAPRFAEAFGAKTFSIAGFTPRPLVAGVMKGSPAEGKLLPGDVIVAASVGSGADVKENPNQEELRKLLADAGEKGQAVSLTVLRGGKRVPVEGLTPNVKLDTPQRTRGLKIVLEHDLDHAELATSLPGSVAGNAEVPAGATVTAIDGQPVKSFHDIFRLLVAVKPGSQVKVEYSTPASETKTKELTLEPEQHAAVAANRYQLPNALPLAELKETRQTGSLFTAAGWGVTETRDFILQFYVTLRRMAGGDVDPSNLMGPVGIFHAGSQFANRGNDWLIWFLAMISANLAVVNFLPIPIVDGGLFTFLVLEKIKGRPVSARTQSIAQVVGLALLLGVFLFVTYNDITRLF
jgi:regulator of sigma E protease